VPLHRLRHRLSLEHSAELDSSASPVAGQHPSYKSNSSILSFLGGGHPSLGKEVCRLAMLNRGCVPLGLMAKKPRDRNDSPILV